MIAALIIIAYATFMVFWTRWACRVVRSFNR